MENYFCGVKNETTDQASVIAHRPMTLADRSQEKLLKSTNCQVLLSCAVIGSYGPCASLHL